MLIREMLWFHGVFLAAVACAAILNAFDGDMWGTLFWSFLGVINIFTFRMGIVIYVQTREYKRIFEVR